MMLAAGEFYTGDNTSTEEDLSMIIPTRFGPVDPLWPAQAFDGQAFNLKASSFKAFNVNAWQAWAFSRLASPDLITVDLRVKLVSVITRSLVQAMDALIRHVMGRAWRGARFAEDITAAATMVAAARG